MGVYSTRFIKWLLLQVQLALVVDSSPTPVRTTHSASQGVLTCGRPTQSQRPPRQRASLAQAASRQVMNAYASHLLYPCDQSGAAASTNHESAVDSAFGQASFWRATRAHEFDALCNHHSLHLPLKLENNDMFSHYKKGISTYLFFATIIVWIPLDHRCQFIHSTLVTFS